MWVFTEQSSVRSMGPPRWSLSASLTVSHKCLEQGLSSAYVLRLAIGRIWDPPSNHYQIHFTFCWLDGICPKSGCFKINIFLCVKIILFACVLLFIRMPVPIITFPTSTSMLKGPRDITCSTRVTSNFLNATEKMMPQKGIKVHKGIKTWMPFWDRNASVSQDCIHQKGKKG